MKDAEKLAEILVTQNLQIAVFVSQLEQRFPGKTLADLMIENMVQHLV